MDFSDIPEWLRDFIFDEDGSVSTSGGISSLVLAYLLKDQGLLSADAPKIGYQGKIPRYKAVRQQVPMDYTGDRLPGESGNRYFTDVFYPEYGNQAEVDEARERATDQRQRLRQRNRSNFERLQPLLEILKTMYSEDRPDGGSGGGGGGGGVTPPPDGGTNPPPIEPPPDGGTNPPPIEPPPDGGGGGNEPPPDGGGGGNEPPPNGGGNEPPPSDDPVQDFIDNIGWEGDGNLSTGGGPPGVSIPAATYNPLTGKYDHGGPDYRQHVIAGGDQHGTYWLPKDVETANARDYIAETDWVPQHGAGDNPNYPQVPIMTEGGREAYDAGGLQALANRQASLQNYFASGKPLSNNAWTAIVTELDRRGHTFAGGGMVPDPNFNAAMSFGGIGGLMQGPGDGMSDSIPAHINGQVPAALGDGEFVVPADVVSGLGNGSTNAGAEKLQSMLDSVRQARTGTKQQGPRIDPFTHMPR